MQRCMPSRGAFREVTDCVPLQRVFIRSLGNDYAKWANDPAYREERKRWAAKSDRAIRETQPV